MAVGLCIGTVNAADTYTSYHLDSKFYGRNFRPFRPDRKGMGSRLRSH